MLNTVVCEAVCEGCGWPVQKLRDRVSDYGEWVRGRLPAAQAWKCYSYRRSDIQQVLFHKPRYDSVRDVNCSDV